MLTHGRGASGRSRRFPLLLPVAPLPQVDFPPSLLRLSLPGAPIRMATSTPSAARPQIVQIPGVLVDDVDEMRSARPRSPSSSISTATSTPGRRTRTGGGNQRRRRATASGPAESADLPQGQSLRHADTHPIRPVGRRAHWSTSTTRPKIFSPSTSADLGRLARARVGGQQRSSRRSRSIRRSWSRRACSSRTCGRRSALRPSTLPRARSSVRSRPSPSRTNDQRPRPRPGTTSSSLIVTGLAARARHRPSCRGTRTDSSGLEQWQAERFSCRVQDPWRECHQHCRGDQGHIGDPAGFDPADHSCQHSLRSHHDHPRLGARR